MKKQALFSLYIAILILPCLEVALRILGYRPFHQVAFHIEARPENCILPHESLGFALNPGEYEVSLNKALVYHVSHGPDSLRISAHHKLVAERPDSLYFFGCSYTYGMGLSDSLTLPFLVSEHLDSVYTRNFGVPGYGTVQAYLQLVNLLSKGDIPDIAIINYADFHDDRNALTPAYRRDLYLGFQRSHKSVQSTMQSARIPYFYQEDKEWKLSFCDWEDVYDNWDQRETFAAVNFLQDLQDQKHSRAIDKEACTRAVFARIKTLCDQNDIRLVVAGLTPSDKTTNLLDSLKQTGIETVDISVDFSLDQYRNAPYDDHPSALAHSVFAARIMQYLSLE